MKIKVDFMQDDTIDGVEVIVKAKARTEEVERILRSVSSGIGEPLAFDPISEEKEIDGSEIVIISKSGRYLSVKTTNGEYVLKEPLYKIEERLDKSEFVRISQSEIVNLKYVEGWSFEGGGIIKIELAGGIHSYTSRRYAVEIRKML